MALIYIALAAVSWGVGGFVAALLYQHSDLGPIAVTFWRYVGGLLLLVAVRPRWPRPTKQLLVSGVGMAVYQTAYYVAIDLGGVGVITVVTLGSGPILVAIGARAFLSERVNPVVLVVALAGLGLLVARNPQTGAHPVAGIAVALVSAAGYAAVTLLGRATTADPYDSAVSGFAIGAVLLLPIALAEGALPARTGLWQSIGLLAFLGAVPTALAYALFFKGLKTVRATTASVVALSEPLAAVALGVLVLHEPLTLWSAVGGGLLLTAVGALAISEHAQERRSRITATIVNPAATTSAPTSHGHHAEPDESGISEFVATADVGAGLCAVRASTTTSARTEGKDDEEDETTTFQRPGESTGPEE